MLGLKEVFSNSARANGRLRSYGVAAFRSDRPRRRADSSVSGRGWNLMAVSCTFIHLEKVEHT